MTRLYKKVKNIGLPPGTITHVEGDALATIDLIDYDADQVKERSITDLETLLKCRDVSTVSWINVIGADQETFKKIKEYFDIHPLVMEDIVNRGQRAKVEDYGDYVFMVMKMLMAKKDASDIDTEQISFILGKGYVISFQEKKGDVLEHVRERIRKNKGRIRSVGADYLLYAIVDAIVDHYFVLLEDLGEIIEDVDEKIIKEMSKETPRKVQQLKKVVIYLRKHIWPTREVIGFLQRDVSHVIGPDTQLYLRDAYDHSIQVAETIEAFRDAVSSIHDIYLAEVSNKMNEIMKVLTIFSAIFIPLTFMAGIYGMNFEYMPELQYKWAYYYLLGAMGTVFLGMLVFFKIKKWI